MSTFSYFRKLLYVYHIIKLFIAKSIYPILILFTPGLIVIGLYAQLPQLQRLYYIQRRKEALFFNKIVSVFVWQIEFNILA